MYLDLFIYQEFTLAFRHPWLKNIFLSQYLSFAILCVEMSRVNKALADMLLAQTLFEVKRYYQIHILFYFGSRLAL